MRRSRMTFLIALVLLANLAASGQTVTSITPSVVSIDAPVYVTQSAIFTEVPIYEPIPLFVCGSIITIDPRTCPDTTQGKSKPAASLHYRPMTIAAIDAHDITSLPTRVELQGYIVYQHVEADGDIHLWLCDSAKFPAAELKPGKKVRSHCFVAEIMPDLPVVAPKGQQFTTLFTVDGITRYDGEHKWVEIHPVERMTVSVTSTSQRNP